jgi:TPR repeat protein/uncharacterized protein YecT (DUF1311 family)
MSILKSTFAAFALVVIASPALAQDGPLDLSQPVPPLVPRASEKPSFDCAMAKTAAARLICADGELARLDGQLGAAFQKRKAQVSGADLSKVVAEQLAWIRSRNTRCALDGKDSAAIAVLGSSKPCVASTIRERIAFLTQTVATSKNAGGPPEPASPTEPRSAPKPPPDYDAGPGRNIGRAHEDPVGPWAGSDPASHSEYTSFDHGCRMLWRAADEYPLPPLPDSFKSICPGRDEMRVIVEGGDSRSWIGLLPRGAKYEDGARFYVNWGSFAQVSGTRLEWRYHGPKLVALILRMTRFDESDSSGGKEISGLVVLRVDTKKLNQTCVVGETMLNEEARAIADDLSKTCRSVDAQAKTEERSRDGNSFKHVAPVATLAEAFAAHRKGDYTTALRQLRLFADKGDARAQTALGIMHHLGQGTPQNDNEAVKWFLLAAKQGNSVAQWILGGMYGSGQGVSQNYAEAVKWSRLAANQGNADAQNSLGNMYAFGRGVPQDYVEAVKWYRLAADQGNAEAQSALGTIYLAGRGVPQSDDEAVKWFRLAADQGNAHAQLGLGGLYYTGHGLPQDYVLAFMWFNLSAVQGNEEAIKYRDEVAEEMTRAQIAQAQRLAREWRPKTADASPAASAPKSEKIESGTISGTGFFVSTKEPAAKLPPGVNPAPDNDPFAQLVSSQPIGSTVLTNSHVVDSCRQIRILSGNQNGTARVVARDDRNDLALLVTDVRPASVANWRLSIRQGEDVVVYGFPLADVLAAAGNVTVGNVTALAGLGNDARFLQISAPVQPGNSGGPLLDRSGNVVGIVVAKLDALKTASTIGDIPQNVNFAIKASVVAAFLGANGVAQPEGASGPALSTPDLAERAKALAMQVVCVRPDTPRPAPSAALSKPAPKSGPFGAGGDASVLGAVQYPSIEAITKNGGCSPKDNTARILKTPNPNDLAEGWKGESRIGTSWSFFPRRYVNTNIENGVYLQGDLISPRGGVTDKNVYVLFSEWICVPP